MRWKAPRDGTRVVKKRFAILPKKIYVYDKESYNHDTIYVWLESYYIVKAYQEFYGWKKKKEFLTKEEANNFINK